MTLKEKIQQLMAESTEDTEVVAEDAGQAIEGEADGSDLIDDEEVAPDNVEQPVQPAITGPAFAGTGISPTVDPVPSFSEDVAALTDGEELTEEFKTKAATIFEAAVLSRVKNETAKIQEAFDKKLTEAIEAKEEALVEKVDGYLGYVVEQWMKENEIALDRGMKLEVMENFFEDLRKLFLEHNIDLPEEKFDVLEAKDTTIETQTKKLDEQLSEIVDLRKKIALFEAKGITEELAKGLVETDKAKFNELVEAIEFDDVVTFQKKAAVIRESYFNKTPNKKTINSPVSGSPVTLQEETVMSTEMRAYVTAIQKFNPAN